MSTAGEMLQSRPDFLSGGASTLAALLDALQIGPPAFDRYAEDGAGFRIYRFGNWEVRTIKEQEEQECIGAVCSTQTAACTLRGRCSRRSGQNASISKATDYIEGERLIVPMDTGCSLAFGTVVVEGV